MCCIFRCFRGDSLVVIGASILTDANVSSSGSPSNVAGQSVTSPSHPSPAPPAAITIRNLSQRAPLAPVALIRQLHGLSHPIGSVSVAPIPQLLSDKSLPHSGIALRLAVFGTRMRLTVTVSDRVYRPARTCKQSHLGRTAASGRSKASINAGFAILICLMRLRRSDGGGSHRCTFVSPGNRSLRPLNRISDFYQRVVVNGLHSAAVFRSIVDMSSIS
jgi:hypothetical protein